MHRKVVDLTTLYNFHKGRMVFFSMDFAQNAAKLWMSPCFGKQEVLSVYMKVVSLNKLDNFHIGRFLSV
jgi:hypothetical protein